MTLADTSAWVEFIRNRSAAVADEVGKLIVGRQIATSEPVVMELLAGARGPQHASELRNLLAAVHIFSVEHLGSWEAAAAVYRTCRRAGFTPRSQLDCLIAAVAIREDVPVLHADRDFDLIARHVPLKVAQANG